MNKPAISGNLAAIPTPAVSAQGTVQYSTATPASHAALVAEVTALRASLGDAVEMVETLRSERDTLLRTLKLCVARLEEYGDAEHGFALESARAALERSAP